MAKPYMPPGIENTQVVSFKCTPEALPDLVRLLEYLDYLGSTGGSRDFMVGDEQFSFDGSGKHRLREIMVNGQLVGDLRGDRNSTIKWVRPE